MKFWFSPHETASISCCQDILNTVVEQNRTKLTKHPQALTNKHHKKRICTVDKYTCKWDNAFTIYYAFLELEYIVIPLSQTYLQASRYPPIMEVGWIFCLTNSSAFFRSSAAIITCLWKQNKHQANQILCAKSINFSRWKNEWHLHSSSCFHEGINNG